MKRIASSLLTVILVVGVLSTVFTIHLVKAGTITVPDDYATIQEAINHASEGDTIRVLAGNYGENEIVVNKSLNICGMGRTSTSISISYLQFVADNINFTGFSLRSYDYLEVSFISSNNSHFYQNGISQAWDGGPGSSGPVFSLYQSDHNNISCNTIYAEKSDGCVNLVSSNHNDFLFNTISSGYTVPYAIGLSYSSDNTFRYNKVSPSESGALGLSQSSRNTFYQNRFSGFLSFSQSSDNLFHHNNVYGDVYIDNTSGVWDNDYPSGGNFWGGYSGTDLYRGRHQNETGSDSIGDTPYLLGGGNRDNYPFMQPYYDFDAALTKITPCRTVVPSGTPLQVNVTVENEGELPITLNLTLEATYSYTPRAEEWSLEANAALGWNRSIPGATISVYQGDTVMLFLHGGDTLHHKFYVDYNGNAFPDAEEPQSQSFINTNITFSFSADTVGSFTYYCAYNQDSMYGAFLVLSQPHDIKQISQTVTLENDETKNVLTICNTSEFLKGKYTLRAYALPVLGEMDTADNSLTSGVVTITIPGDVDGDFDVDILDVVKIASIYTAKLGDPKFNPNCDLRPDNKIDILDVARCTGHYGEKYP